MTKAFLQQEVQRFLQFYLPKFYFSDSSYEFLLQYSIFLQLVIPHLITRKLFDCILNLGNF